MQVVLDIDAKCCRLIRETEMKCSLNFLVGLIYLEIYVNESHLDMMCCIVIPNVDCVLYITINLTC